MTMISKAAPRSLAALTGRKSMTALLAALVQTVGTWRAQRRSRHALSHLSDFHLRDVGLDPMIRDHEATRPFWK